LVAKKDERIPGLGDIDGIKKTIGMSKLISQLDLIKLIPGTDFIKFHAF
jgi:hypothetical protein